MICKCGLSHRGSKIWIKNEVGSWSSIDEKYCAFCGRKLEDDSEDEKQNKKLDDDEYPDWYNPDFGG